jgi:LysR family nitrogen assimilation transcriptional regulator
VTPTPAGKTLYRHAVSITRLVEAARFDISAPKTDREEAGDVAVGVPPTLMPLVGFSLFSRLRAEYPRIRLHLSESSGGQLGELLLRGHLDMMLTFRERAPSRTLLVPILEESLFLVERKPAKAGGATMATEALSGVPLVLPSAVHGIREVIEDAFAVEGMEPLVIADIDSVDVLLQVAKSGLASAILPSTSLLLCDGKFATRQLAPPIWRRISVLTFEARKQSSTALIVQRVLTDLMHSAVRSGLVRGARILDAG